MNDADLLRRYADTCDELAFAELVQRHLGLVYAAALRRVGGDAHLAKDISQQVFTALARDARRVADRTVLAGWLYVATRNLAAAAVRREHRRRSREETFEILNQIDSSRNSADWERLRPVIDAAMDTLRRDDRDAVLLRFFEGRTFSEIGARLRLQENAARMRVERALEKLRSALEQRGVTSTAAALSVALASQAAASTPAGLATSVTSAALASTTIGAGTLGGFLTLMSTTKTVTGIATAVAVLAIGTALFQRQSNRNTQVALRTVRDERDALRSRLVQTEKRIRAEEASTAASIASNASSTAITPKQNQPTASAAWQPTGPVDYVLNHPSARKAFVQQQIQSAEAHFARFFSLAGLSSQQQEEFLRLVGEQAEAKLDLTASIRAQGYGPNNPPQDPQAYLELMKLDAQAEQEFQGKLRSLLGDDDYRQFTAFRSSLPEINVTDQLASQLYASDSPLTPQQAQDIVRVLKADRFHASSTPSPANMLNGTFVSSDMYQGAMLQSNLQNGSVTFTLSEWPAPVTDAALAQAKTVLSASQWNALRQLQAQQLAQLMLAPPPPPQPDVQKLLTRSGGK